MPLAVALRLEAILRTNPIKSDLLNLDRLTAQRRLAPTSAALIRLPQTISGESGHIYHAQRH